MNIKLISSIVGGVVLVAGSTVAFIKYRGKKPATPVAVTETAPEAAPVAAPVAAAA